MKKIFTMMMIGVMMTAPMMAQETPDIHQTLDSLTRTRYESQMTLSVEDAIQYAIQQNRSLQNASLEVKKAHAQRWQTIAAMLPQASGTAQYTNMCDYKMDFMGRNVSMPPYIQHSVNAQVGLSAQGIIGVLLNNIAIEMQDITLEKTEADLRSNVVQSYVSVLVMSDVISLLDSSLNNLEILEKQTQRSVEVGAAEQTQADQMKVRVNMMRNTVNANKRTLTLADNSLHVLLDLPTNVELTLTSRLHDLLSTETAMALLMEDFKMENNFNYQLLAKNVDLAKMNLQMAGWAYAPTIGGTYMYTAKKYFSDESTFNMQPPHTIAVSVNIPLWSSGKRAAAVTEKKIALQEAQNTFTETTDNLKIQYKQLSYNLVNSLETFLNQKENLDVTHRVIDKVSQKYSLGAASFLELTTASDDLISAQSSYVQASLELVDAMVNLENFMNNK